MGWSIGYDSNWKRDIGYGVPATCDHPGCGAAIHRGLSHVCGDNPYGGEHGCGLFFCEQHLRAAGEKRHRAPLCQRCYSGRMAFTPTPDTEEWMRWKLTDESWAKWRKQNRGEVERMKAALATGEGRDG